ncbi:MAG TPA: hypothetical protein VE913_18820, partial [Longimicrobium sp.]|nr:hypothetical protein [Longimicrobium sp.]
MILHASAVPREGAAPSLPFPTAPGESELHGEVGAAVWRGLRCVLRWVSDDGTLVIASEMEAWERELLLADWEPAARLPLAVLAGELADASGGMPDRVAWACMCVTDWALGRGAVSVGLAFAEAAALARPRRGRYAWAAGRLLRAHGREESGRAWLHRAADLAERARDGEARALEAGGAQ